MAFCAPPPAVSPVDALRSHTFDDSVKDNKDGGVYVVNWTDYVDDPKQPEQRQRDAKIFKTKEGARCYLNSMFVDFIQVLCDTDSNTTFDGLAGPTEYAGENPEFIKRLYLAQNSLLVGYINIGTCALLKDALLRDANEKKVDLDPLIRTLNVRNPHLANHTGFYHTHFSSWNVKCVTILE